MTIEVLKYERGTESVERVELKYMKEKGYSFREINENKALHVCTTNNQREKEYRGFSVALLIE